MQPVATRTLEVLVLRDIDIVGTDTCGKHPK